MNFKIPSKIRLSGVEHEVRLHPHLGADTNARGTASYFSRTIDIDPALPPVELQHVFLHEVVHMIDHIFATELTESQIGRLAYGVSELIQQLENDG